MYQFLLRIISILHFFFPVNVQPGISSVFCSDRARAQLMIATSNKTERVAMIGLISD